MQQNSHYPRMEQVFYDPDRYDRRLQNISVISNFLAMVVFVVFCFASYFEYKSWTDVFLILGLSATLGFLGGLLGYLPVVGPVTFWLATPKWIMPIAYNLGLEVTWVTHFLFWGHLFICMMRNVKPTFTAALLLYIWFGMKDLEQS